MHKETIEFVYLDTVIEEIQKITNIETDMLELIFNDGLEDKDISIYGLEYGLIYLNTLRDIFSSHYQIKSAFDELLKTNDPCTLIAITD